MNDAEYTFMQTNRERKTISRSAKYRRNGSRSKKCTLPSDHLTPAQKKGLNGTVKTYDMNKPHSLRELRTWPDDLRHVYMDELLSRYRPSNKDLALMLNCSPSTVSQRMPSVFACFRGRGGQERQTEEQAIAWQRFISGEEPVLTLNPEAPPVVVPASPEVHTWPGKVTTPGGALLYDYICVEFTGKVDDLISVIQTGPLHLTGADTYTFTIKAARKED